MDGRPRRIKKFAFTIVCVYNRLRVDGARNSTFSQYREHEVRYKKYTGHCEYGDFVQHVIIGGNAWLSFAFRDLGLIISRSHVRVLFHVFCSLKSVAFLG